MSGFYSRLADVALKKITQFGQPVVLRRYVAGSDMVDVEGTIQAVVLPASKSNIEAFDNRLENGTLVDETLRSLLAAAKGAAFEPRGADELEFDGQKWSVLSCVPLNPAGTPLVYKIGVKRA